jgi:hypothetical protein
MQPAGSARQTSRLPSGGIRFPSNWIWPACVRLFDVVLLGRPARVRGWRLPLPPTQPPTPRRRAIYFPRVAPPHRKMLIWLVLNDSLPFLKVLCAPIYCRVIDERERLFWAPSSSRSQPKTKSARPCARTRSTLYCWRVQKWERWQMGRKILALTYSYFLKLSGNKFTP